MNGSAPLPYFYRIAVPTGYEELADLELRSLVGEFVPDPAAASGVDRVRRARVGADVQSAAFVGEACRTLASAPTGEELLARAAKLALQRERFRIILRRIGDQGIANRREVEIAFADVIEGRPDLDRPGCELVVIARHEGWLLGELVSRSDGSWQGHQERPHQYSIALPPRIARALVNLVARPGDRLLDPCCGVGTVLVEAAHLGVTAAGWEINPRVAEHARANICHWGVEAPVTTGDGCAARGRYDGAVIDLPYGQASRRDERICRRLIAAAAERCRLLAVVSGDDMREIMHELGLRELGLARAVKGSLVRHIHWMCSDAGERSRPE